MNKKFETFEEPIKELNECQMKELASSDAWAFIEGYEAKLGRKLYDTEIYWDEELPHMVTLNHSQLFKSERYQFEDGSALVVRRGIWGYGFFDRRNLADGLSQTAYSEWYRGGQHDVVRGAPTGKELSIMWGYPSEERENMSEETELAIAADVCRREIKRYRLNETGGGILDGPLKLTHASQRYIYFPKEMRYNLIGTKLNGFGLSIDDQPIFEHHSTPNSSEENEVHIVGKSIEMVINQLKQNKKDFLPPIEISFNAQSP